MMRGVFAGGRRVRILLLPISCIAAVVICVAFFLVPARGTAAQTPMSTIVASKVLQPEPGYAHEDYRAGSDIPVSVAVTIPVDAPAAESYLSIDASDLHPVVFAPRFSHGGARQWCGNTANTPKASVDAGLRVVDHEWMNTTHPGTGRWRQTATEPLGVTSRTGDDPTTTFEAWLLEAAGNDDGDDLPGTAARRPFGTDER